MPAENQAVTSKAEELYRSEYRRIYSTLIRILNDWDLAEEVANEAFAIALEKWSEDGIPANPVSWLISVAKFKAIDAIRENSRFADKSEEIALRFDQIHSANLSARKQEIQDDRLRLIFACCHPAIEPTVQIALTLREVCGLSTDEIASAFLTSPTTMAQRIVRGKNKIRLAKIPIEVPSLEELPDRLESVLAVLYLVFNEGYAASTGESHLKLDLTEESIRLCRMVVKDIPTPETLGLLSLMLLQESRRDTRVDSAGNIILLQDQNRQQWNRELIQEGLELLGFAARIKQLGFYQIQALIASVHAKAELAEQTDWTTIVKLYDLLLEVRPSPVIELNRAVAVAMGYGPESGLQILQSLEKNAKLENYHLLYAVKGDLLRRASKWKEAEASFQMALPLVSQAAERRFLEKRIRELQQQMGEK